MSKYIGKVRAFLDSIDGYEFGDITLLPQSGSDRQYFRVEGVDGKSFIATIGNNIKENRTFINFTKHFKSKGLNVPEIIAESDDGQLYLQSDLGSVSLLDVLEKEGLTENVKSLFKKSIDGLIDLQLKGHEGLNYNDCITSTEFGKQAIISDLLYFKYYFLDTLQTPYNKQDLLDDFEMFALYLTKTAYKFFMFRDFQSRNIMIKDNEPFFIDYQGGMLGAPQYDLASLLWQARANLPEEWKVELRGYYISEFENKIGTAIDKELFEKQYYGYVLIRLLQVLGAYGFRGLFERKAQFLTSIPQALENLKWFINNRSLGLYVPELKRVLNICTSDAVISKFTIKKASSDTPLLVKVNSFSYLKNGYPKDETGTGGGFVFDCRGILNPGRIDEYKTQSGLDKPVKDYLEQNTRMPQFINSIFDIVDINVEDYLSRGFENLTINFGCTGGQHRSVYAAEATARHLKNKYRVKVELNHINKENWRKEL